MSILPRVRAEIARIVGDAGDRQSAIELRAVHYTERGFPVEHAVRAADRETKSIQTAAKSRHGSNTERKDWR